ncbi:hybrid sensor histidine kinase/response regulator [Aphanothece sacrum]|uniref:histidine kinase n=1 Tax=Aphanothece sacrum FPU1 TaxID=1920663 RepID=A0A401IC60_APHSA|nr:hybrid sensor histidine kinase/response regulator [Aphanothece sacrum]GBF78829.1 CheA like protein [Aphanothece sacrum FPU1]GBF83061.1 CheA like protein [Aphanothece sacrum FPU3]
MVSDFHSPESYNFFIQEAPERLQELEHGLLELRCDPNLLKIYDLIRIAHSIKGGAACIGLTQIQELAHELETIFKIIYEHKPVIDLELEDLLLNAYDCFRFTLESEIRTGSHQGEAAIQKIKYIISQVEAKLATERPLTNLPKSQQQKQKNLTDFLFSEEVKEGINRLETILQHPNQSFILEGLKAQIEIFQGLGELINFSGFVAITKAILKALKFHPEAVKEIGQLALEELRSTQIAVLSGNNISEISPSQSLINFTKSPILSQPINPKTESNGKIIGNEEIKIQKDNEYQTFHYEAITDSSSPTLEMRVDVKYLRRLNNLVEDLVTQDNRFLLHNQEHQETLENLTQRFSRFQELTRNSYKELPKSLRIMIEDLAQIKEGIQDFALLNQGFQQILRQRQKTLKQVQINLQQTQMISVGHLLNLFPRMIRDLSAQENKEVNLQLEGTNTLIDKAILDKLYEPLVHLIRNAFDHGIESPSIRQSQGKSPRGTITISTYYNGNHTYLEVKDDGQGINLDKLRSSIIKMNLLSETEVTTISKKRLYEYLFFPGLSTASQLSHLSGRGMGLSAVHQQIQILQGTLSITSEPGEGTTFTLRLPLTLTISKLLVFKVHSSLFAIAETSLLSLTVVAQRDLKIQNDDVFYRCQGKLIPLYSLLSGKLKTHQLIPKNNQQKSIKITLLLLSDKKRTIALKIDKIVMEQDLVIKPFNEAIKSPSYLSGCTILGDGRLVPVIEGQAILEQWFRHSETEDTFVKKPSDIYVSTLPKILIIDDSLTIRQTLAITLEKAGYEVFLAKDGWEGMLQIEYEFNIGAVICDIEMPRMNGLEFLTRCRQLKGDSFPIIMLTSRNSKQYRELAISLGATDYLTKPYLDKDLLDLLHNFFKHKQSKINN